MPAVVQEGDGTHKRKIFKCASNSKRLNQTSIYLSQICRGNIDINPMHYFTNPLHPSMKDIAAVTDYVIGYQMKGAETMAVERQNMCNLIMKATDETGTTYGLYTLSRSWFNSSSISRCSSWKEAQCLLAGLPLVICSENIESIPIL